VADLIFDGPDTLFLEEDGKAYRPGDRMPHSLSHERRVNLQEAGLRFTTVHEEPVVTPDGKPAEMAAAEQIEGPAVVAAVDDAPIAVRDGASKADESEQPAHRASRKGN
jgi:hypothetical protein